VAAVEGSAATEHLRALARRIVAAAVVRVPLRAALLGGSAGRGDADLYSDLDLLLYVDDVPPPGTRTELRDALGGKEPWPRESSEDFAGEEFDVDGIRCEVSFVSVPFVERRLDEILGRIEDFDSPSQKAVAGLLEGLALHGNELVERWRVRARAYPEELRREMIRRHWRVLPLWYHAGAIALRDAELWRLDSLLDAAFDLLAVLAALNRVYFSRFELKRTRTFAAKLELAPRRLVERLESLFQLDAEAAAAELGRLVEETRAIVSAELPDLELPLRHPPGTRRRPWSE